MCQCANVFLQSRLSPFLVVSSFCAPFLALWPVALFASLVLSHTLFCLSTLLFTFLYFYLLFFSLASFLLLWYYLLGGFCGNFCCGIRFSFALLGLWICRFVVAPGMPERARNKQYQPNKPYPEKGSFFLS